MSANWPEHLGDIARFDPEVEFLGNRISEAAAYIADVVGTCPLGPRFEAPGQPANHPQVPGHRFGDSGPLDLENNCGPVGSIGRVRLRQRGARQRLRVDSAEEMAEFSA
jgi:hypothetical protein